MSPSRRTATLGRFSKCRVPTGPTIPAIHICAYTPAAWTPARAQPVTPRLGICYSIVISPASRMVSFFELEQTREATKGPAPQLFLVQRLRLLSQVQSGEPSGTDAAVPPAFVPPRCRARIGKPTPPRLCRPRKRSETLRGNRTPLIQVVSRVCGRRAKIANP